LFSMNWRSLLFRWILAILVFSFFLSGTAHAAPRWLVLPFENQSDDPQYHWLGEGLARMVSYMLSAAGVDVVPTEEREAAYRLLSFPEGIILSRASSLRMAQSVGATMLLIGTYKVTGTEAEEHLTLWMRLIDVSAGMVAYGPTEARGPLADVIELQVLSVWDILLHQRVPVSLSRNEFTSRFRQIPAAAFEMFAKALFVALPERVKMLKRAVALVKSPRPEASFSPAVYELGKGLYHLGEYEAAADWLSRLNIDWSGYWIAQFYLGVCFYHQGDLASAAERFSAVAEQYPSDVLFNNLAVIDMKRRKLDEARKNLIVALSLNGEDVDVGFNYGYLLWLSGADEEAVSALEKVTARRTDPEALYVLSRCFARLGRKKEAERALSAAEEQLPDVESWRVPEKMPFLGRMITEPGVVKAIGWAKVHSSDEGRGRTSWWVQTLLAAADRLVTEQRNGDAVIVLTKLLEKKPNVARAHYLRGVAHERLGAYPLAVTDYQAAVFWDPDLVAGYVGLARIYLALGEKAKAWENVKRALALDSQNAEALALDQKLRQGTP